MSWRVYTRGAIPFYRFDTVFLSVRDFSKKIAGTEVNRVFYATEGNKLWWAWDERQIKKAGQHVLALCANKDGRAALFKKFDFYTRQALAAARRIYRINLASLRDQGLIDLFGYLYKRIAFAHVILNVDIDGVDVVFESFLKKKIKNELAGKLNEQEFAALHQKLGAPAFTTYLQRHDIGIMRAAAKKNIDETDIGWLYKQFWWTGLGWENMKPHGRMYFEKAVRKCKRAADLSGRLKEAASRVANVKKEREALFKKYNFSRDISFWLDNLDAFNHYLDLRKEMQVKTVFVQHLMLKEVSRRLEIPVGDLEWLWHKEIFEVLRGKPFDAREAARRKGAMCVKMSKADIQTWSGKEAVERRKREIKEDEQRVKEFKGLAVSAGKVTARVKVCSGAKEALRKIKKGDILVCGMTLPDYVPAMKKAAAIITDEGGITCHAAIISRELGIPCVVGTKIATNVLKDGDLVEVNAERGIVKILKK